MGVGTLSTTREKAARVRLLSLLSVYVTFSRDIYPFLDYSSRSSRLQRTFNLPRIYVTIYVINYHRSTGRNDLASTFELPSFPLIIFHGLSGAVIFNIYDNLAAVAINVTVVSLPAMAHELKHEKNAICI